MPVESRSDSSATTSTRRSGGRASAARRADAFGGGASAAIVPNSPQPGQRPSQRPGRRPALGAHVLDRLRPSPWAVHRTRAIRRQRVPAQERSERRTGVRRDSVAPWRARSSVRNARWSSGAARCTTRSLRRLHGSRPERTTASSSTRVWQRRGARHPALGAAARELPPYDQPVRTPTTCSQSIPQAAVCGAADEIELERDSARLWHWRARTAELQAAGVADPAGAVRDVRPADRRDGDARVRARAPPRPDARRLPRVRQGLPPSLTEPARRGACDRRRAAPRARLARGAGAGLGRRPARHVISTPLSSAT